MRTTKYIFNGTGTLGDLLPLLATAKALQASGAKTHVFASDSVRQLAQQMGVPFTSVGTGQRNNLTSVEENFGQSVFPTFEPTMRGIENELERGSQLVLVDLSPVSASTLLAERYGIPLCRIVLSPYRIPSAVAPHWPWSEQLRGPDADKFRTIELPRLMRQRHEHPYIVKRLNGFRAQLGLKALRSTLPLDRFVRRRLAFFPDWFAPPAADWPSNTTCLGFPLPDCQEPLEAPLREWLETHSEPIVYTPGTGVTETRHFFEVAQEVCARLQRPGVFLSGHFDSNTIENRGDIFYAKYANLKALLPRASLLVHHGGIGTTARALEAAVPQIISPQAYDQPDNGHRTWQVGAGSMIMRHCLDAVTLEKVAIPILGSPEVRATIKALSHRIKSVDALELAALDLMRPLDCHNAHSFSRNSQCTASL